MKRILIAIALTLLLPAAAYAQSVDISTDKPTEVTGLTDGYYDLTVTCKNSAVDENTYIYGISDDYTMSSTVIPKSDKDITVKVKGIGVTDGKCEIGISGGGTVTVSGADLSPSKAHNLITGGDMSEVSYIEGLGGVYKDADGNAVDPFTFLAENGVNMARIRLSNNTGKGTGDGNYYLPAGSQDEADCLALAKRAKDAGMGIQFTFNYSDYWSNGVRQIIPSAWVKQIKDELGYDVKDADFLKSMTAAQKQEIQEKLCSIIYDYTYDIMSKLKAQGTVPEYVSLGNEINGGMLFPFGNAYKAQMSTTKKPFDLVWDKDQDGSNDIPCGDEKAYLKKFLKSGYDAVKAVSPDTQVIIHLATEGNGSINDGKYTWLMDEFTKAGVVDVLGASYYPAWSGSTADKAREFAERMYAKYGKPVMFMETGYSWNDKKKNGYDGQLTANAADYVDKYPYTQDGHAGYMAELINEMKLAGDSCLGALYWDPCMIHVEDTKNPNESLSGWAIRENDDLPDGNVVENTTLFDFDGKAIKSVGVFKNSKNNTGKLAGSIDESGAGVVTATVKNTTLEAKKANLYVTVYDENGVLQSVKIDSKTVGAGESVTLSLDKPEGNHKSFLWNGENFAPLTK